MQYIYSKLCPLKSSVIFLTICRLLPLFLRIIRTCRSLKFIYRYFLLPLKCLKSRIKFSNSEITRILFLATFRWLSWATLLLFFFFIIAARVVDLVVMAHHLLHCSGVRAIAAGVSVTAIGGGLLLHHHMWEKLLLMIPICEQMIEETWRWWCVSWHLNHASRLPIALWLYVGHIGAKLG